MEFSLDIATAVSGAGSAVGFLRSQKKQLKLSIAQAQRQWRIEQMFRLIEGLADICEKEGGRLLDAGARADAGRPLTINSDDLTGFCTSVYRYIQINVDLKFSVWATKEEIVVLESIKLLAIQWNYDYVTIGEKALDDHSKLSEIPKIEDLMANLAMKIKELSSLLRKQVEAVAT